MDYAKGKIYKLMYEGNCIYVGSTVNPLTKRKQGHDHSAKKGTSAIYTFMRQVGPKNVTIELHQNFPCKSVYELENQEHKVINVEKNNNPHLLNTRITCPQSPEELRKNKDKNEEEWRKNEEKRCKYEEEHKADWEGERGHYRLCEIQRRQQLLNAYPPPYWFLQSKMHEHMWGIERLIENAPLNVLKKLGNGAGVKINPTDKKHDIVDKIKSIYKPRVVAVSRYLPPVDPTVATSLITLKSVSIAAVSFGVLKIRLDQIQNEFNSVKTIDTPHQTE